MSLLRLLSAFCVAGLFVGIPLIAQDGKDADKKAMKKEDDKKTEPKGDDKKAAPKEEKKAPAKQYVPAGTIAGKVTEAGSGTIEIEVRVRSGRSGYRNEKE